MTITYSIWQGSKLISIDNIAHEVKAIVEAMFSNNSRPLNNSYLLMKEEN